MTTLKVPALDTIRDAYDDLVTLGVTPCAAEDWIIDHARTVAREHAEALLVTPRPDEDPLPVVLTTGLTATEARAIVRALRIALATYNHHSGHAIRTAEGITPQAVEAIFDAAAHRAATYPTETPARWSRITIQAIQPATLRKETVIRHYRRTYEINAVMQTTTRSRAVVARATATARGTVVGRPTLTEFHVIQ